LEVGLVKLVEMRRLASIESILERLADLEAPLANRSNIELKAAAAPDSKPADGFPEKKTLKFEARSDASIENSVQELVIHAPLEKSSVPVIDLDFLKTVPVRLPPIPSEELEHVEDAWLDEAYERKLSWSGDDLAPIADSASWLGVADIDVEPRTS